MPNTLLQYDATHIIGLSFEVFAMIITAVLIHRFTKKYELRQYNRYGLAELVEQGWNWKPKEGEKVEYE